MSRCTHTKLRHVCVCVRERERERERERKREGEREKKRDCTYICTDVGV